MMEFKNAEEKINFLAQYLPAIKEVKDQKTAAAVVDVWLKALEMSPLGLPLIRQNSKREWIGLH